VYAFLLLQPSVSLQTIPKHYFFYMPHFYSFFSVSWTTGVIGGGGLTFLPGFNYD